MNLHNMSHEITIDPATGAVSIGEISLTLCEGLAYEAAKSELSSFRRGEQDHRNGYRWLHLHGLSFGGKPAGLGLCFFHNHLCELNWGVSLREDTSDTSWPTQEEYDREIAFHREMLRPMLSRPFSAGNERFPWGIVWAVFDAKGGDASAGLRYGSG
jgi:hypothetical protein